MTLPHDPFHRASWRALRLGALVLVVLFLVVLVPISLLLWRLSAAPLDVTALASRWLPVAVQAGPHPGQPAGRLVWQRLTIAWHPGRAERGFSLHADDLRVLRMDGSPALRMGQAQLVVPISPLLGGVVAPRVMSGEHVAVVLRRGADGSVDLDLPGARKTGKTQDAFSLDMLERVALKDGAITLLGRADVPPLKVRDVTVSGNRDPHAGRHLLWRGDLRAVVQAPGGETAQLVATGRAATEGVAWHLGMSPIEPTAFAPFLPNLARWHAPLSFVFDGMETEGRFGDLFRPRYGLAIARMNGHATLGAGQILQDGAPPLTILGGSAGLTVSPTHPGQRSARLSITNARLSLADRQNRPTSFAAGAEFVLSDLLAPRGIDATAHAEGSSFDLPALSAIWPVGLMKGARRWVVRNMVAGTGRGLSVDAVLHSSAGWDGLQPTAMRGALHIDDATVHWLRPVVPAEHVSADFGFESADTLKIVVHSGQQRADDAPGAPTLALSDGVIRIAQLYARDQTASFTMGLDGDLASYIRLLSVPRLHLLAGRHLPFASPSGPVHANATLTMPLVAHVRDEDIHVRAHAAYHDVHLDDVLLGRAVDAASGEIDATETGLDLRGQETLGGVSTKTTLHQSFHMRGLKDELVRIRSESDFDPESLIRARLATDGLFDGHAKLTSDFVEYRDGTANVDLTLDLHDAALEIPVWRKATGTTTTAHAHIGLRDGEIAVLDDLHAEGPDLRLNGRTRVRDGKVRDMMIDAFRIGRSGGDATIGLPQSTREPIIVSVHAPVLDLAPLFEPTLKSGTLTGRRLAPSPRRKWSQRTLPQQKWIVDVQAGRLFYARNGALGGVVAHLEDIDGQLRRAGVAWSTPTAARIVLEPGQKGRRLSADVQDLGVMLSASGLNDRLRGGRARLRGIVGQGGATGLPPFEGQLDVGPFAFRRPPAALTTATHLSLYDWSKADADRFQVQELSLPISVRNDVLTIHDGHLGNAALGATVRGAIGLDDLKLDLHGTVVPVFAVNALPGRLPGIGKLFSPEKGGGLLAATFTVGGMTGAPDLRVNPFSVFLPGVLRRLVE